MKDDDLLLATLERFPRAEIGHLATPLEAMPNLGRELGLSLFVKRDDCTGIAFGGNKVRQMEYYLGAAQAVHADVLLITGAVQSNFVRIAAAMGRRLGMECHIQLEERVPDISHLHRTNGNVLLDRLLGATLHSYPEGEDEAGADAEIARIADALRGSGQTPYIIPLGASSKPLGALGYVRAAIEVLPQIQAVGGIDEIVVASGSALTHAGLLLGLRLIGDKTPVRGVCVRRNATQQTARVLQRVAATAALLGVDDRVVTPEDVHLTDAALGPGYGQMATHTRAAIERTARTEGLFLDPVYTGKVMAALIAKAQEDECSGRRVLFWHTGGQPALFGYADQLYQD
ncbi:D-cysteine desulfhydrase family protein [Sulfitobacter sp. SK012]|uniref:D-cysteine desulfhydrase family protein n=1 Tax=Sulfitobacter sp. SK012 TaxID=1389005 RepID=UPI000E0A8B6E|nr:D-cysteine desulfhydrase family protein [Sulfitobacter sp. SK012]AXI46496.1 D-cysteine desulfhydrase family protein [Sulfitobacter sp. SK012]